MNVLATGLSCSLTLFIITACGGDNVGVNTQSGIIEQPQDEASPTLHNQSGGVHVNGELTGHLVSTYRNQPVQVDLSTGLMTEIPVDTIQNWLARNGYPSEKDSYFGTGGTNSSQYIQTVPECFRRQGTLDYDSCVAIYSANFEKIEQFRLSDFELSMEASLSPSGKYIAYNEYNWSSGSRWSDLILSDVAAKSVVEIFGIDIGEDGPRYISAGPSPLAWAPNGTLVYTVPSDDRVIVYITKPDSLEVVNTIALPASYQGDVVSLDVSPDGSKLLMGYDPKQGPYLGGVLLLDFETLQVSVPAIVPSEIDIVPLGDNIKGYIRTPRWSPDGQWIMVVEGIANYFDFDIAITASLYAVSANKTRTVLTNDSPTDAILIRVETLDSSAGLRESWLGDDSSYDWVQ